jgi:hexosaminidase
MSRRFLVAVFPVLLAFLLPVTGFAFEAARYAGEWFDPRTGERKPAGELRVQGGQTRLPTRPPQTRGAVMKAIFLETNITARELGKEGYRLSVDENTIRIAAAEPAGVFYGVQTLRQLLPVEIESPEEKAGVDWSVPAVDITDRPRFPWRGMLLDSCRHFFPVKDVKHFIDVMAMHKMNIFHWHLTDDQGWRVEIKAYPKLTEVGSTRKATVIPGTRKQKPGAYGGFYTQEQLRDIVAYAAKRHVTIVPEIEMPGHSVAALASYSWLGCTGGPYEVRVPWGVSKDLQCAGEDRVFTFLEAVLSEVVDIFPGPYVHLGCDEAPTNRWKACPKCQARIKAEGLKNEHELQIWFTQRIERFLMGRNRRVVGWADFLEGGPMKDTIVMVWRGAGRKDGIGTAMKAINAGQDIIRTTGTYCYYDYYQTKDRRGEPPAAGWGFIPLRRVYQFRPLAGIPEGKAHKVLGSQGNIWTESIPDIRQVDYQAYPRSTALAEVLWSCPEARDYDDFYGRLLVWLKRLEARGVSYRDPAKGDGLPSEKDRIGGWQSPMPVVFAVREWDVTGKLKPGATRIIFQYTSGRCRLDIEWAAVEIDGKEVARDTHAGTTGARHENNAYAFDLTEIPKDARVVLKASIRSDGGTDSNGIIRVIDR